MASMREHMGDQPDEEQTYLGPDLSPELMASFFRSAATLYRARPWAHIPANRSVFSVTIEQLGLREAALVVIRQMGESLGFILFSSLDDYELFQEATRALEQDERIAVLGQIDPIAGSPVDLEFAKPAEPLHVRRIPQAQPGDRGRDRGRRVGVESVEPRLVRD